VLDMFGGSGSTLIGAHLEGRVAFLMELDPKFCDAIVARYAAQSKSNTVIKNGKEITVDPAEPKNNKRSKNNG